MWTYSRAYSVPLVSVHLSASTTLRTLLLGSISSPAAVSFFQRHLTFLEPLYFRMNLRVPLSISAVRTTAFGIGVALKLEISLSRNDI